MYNHPYTHSNSHHNERQPAQDAPSNDYYDEWLRNTYEPVTYPANGDTHYYEQPLQSMPPPSSIPTMYTQETDLQMLYPGWQQYNSSLTVSHGYNYQLPYSMSLDMNATSIPSPPILYEPSLSLQGYGQSFTPATSLGHTHALLPLPMAAHPPSPTSHSPRSHSPSPHGLSPSPISPPSDGLMSGGYPYPQIAPALPAVPSPPHVPHILPHPQPVQQRQRIPQTLEAGHSNSKVEFRMNGVLGVRVQDAIRNFVDIDGGKDRVLARIGARTIRLALHWPGAQPVGSYVTIKDHNEPVTRTEFAHRAAVAIARMLVKVAKTQHANARFLLGTDGINVNNLWVSYVVPAAQNMWIAELEAEVPNT